MEYIFKSILILLPALPILILLILFFTSKKIAMFIIKKFHKNNRDTSNNIVNNMSLENNFHINIDTNLFESHIAALESLNTHIREIQLPSDLIERVNDLVEEDISSLNNDFKEQYERYANISFDKKYLVIDVFCDREDDILPSLSEFILVLKDESTNDVLHIDLASYSLRYSKVCSDIFLNGVLPPGGCFAEFLFDRKCGQPYVYISGPDIHTYYIESKLSNLDTTNFLKLDIPYKITKISFGYPSNEDFPSVNNISCLIDSPQRNTVYFSKFNTIFDGDSYNLLFGNYGNTDIEYFVSFKYDEIQKKINLHVNCN